MPDAASAACLFDLDGVLTGTASACDAVEVDRAEQLEASAADGAVRGLEELL